MQRRKFSREYKLDAVKLVKERGVTVAQAAGDRDVHENVLRKWQLTSTLFRAMCRAEFADATILSSFYHDRFSTTKFGRIADSLDIISIWIQHKGRIVPVVVGP